MICQVLSILCRVTFTVCHEKFSTIILLDKFFVVKVITISINFVLVNIIVGAADPHHVLVNPPPLVLAVPFCMHSRETGTRDFSAGLIIPISVSIF